MDHNHSSHSHSGTTEHSCCTPKRGRKDWLLIVGGGIVLVSFLVHVFGIGMAGMPMMIHMFTEAIGELVFVMWWGVAIGIVAVGMLSAVPQELVQSLLGRSGSMSGILRATVGGVLLDLCSHGILLVGMQLYRRGVSLGQMMAFLIASPWNSFSLTLILWSLLGLKLTLSIIVLSLLIAFASGVFFEFLVHRGVLPKNPHSVDHDSLPPIGATFRTWWSGVRITPSSSVRMLQRGFKESKMVLRWVFFGMVLSAALRAIVPDDFFASVFAPTLLGLGATLIFATILEVCSEGSAPLAADFVTRAGAPGNTFAFLMTGVSTDYTEILSIKETTGSWKIAFFLPLVTVPQIALLAWILNGGG